MGVQATVVFTDLHGSTAVFEALGNTLATDLVTRLTRSISEQCIANGGRVIKTLGDGVLALFTNRSAAIQAVVELQRTHSKSTAASSANQIPMPIRIGVANGDVELVDGDCYGDAVNVAARLCDLSGPGQIWANSSSLDGVGEIQGVSLRLLGPIHVRGRSEPCAVFQIEWREDVATDFLTMQGALDPTYAVGTRDVLGREIELSCLNDSKTFRSYELPANIGRVKRAEFVVDDPRVSRMHANLLWRNGSVVFVDTSSFGSWVRFADSSGSDVSLRREECVLHGQGEIALGASFADKTAPIVRFQVR